MEEYHLEADAGALTVFGGLIEGEVVLEMEQYPTIALQAY